MSLPKIKIKPKVQSRARIWCFTINNPDQKIKSHLTHHIFLNQIKTIVWQIEEGKEKTPHIQGVLQFNNQHTFSQVREMLPKAHIEICKNFLGSKIYCQKKEGRISGPTIYPPVRNRKLNEFEIARIVRDSLREDGINIPIRYPKVSPVE